MGLIGCSPKKPAPAAAPSNVNFTSSIEPATGVGSRGILTARYSVPVGHTIREARVLLNSELDGRNACYVYYSTVSGFSLIDDSGMKAKAGAGANMLENSQCTLDLSGSSAQPANGSITLTLVLKFKPAFVGTRHVFLYAETSDGANSGLISGGIWSVTL
jgi:hypothetical protein